ncbi:hypothetical protein JCM19237_5970 [Photobacterium aphoticum]|uniref:Long-chain fatty acid transport protein n=1 Tax=Photobacterium aphoticum TaxID=754436 RepID=A0A090R614_9GAMM|nr:hypothetical protein JCM19237_5970 [Photobacterium aphoticum]
MGTTANSGWWYSWVINLDKDFTHVSLFARFHASSAFSFGAEWRIKDVEDHGVMLSARYPF